MNLVTSAQWMIVQLQPFRKNSDHTIKNKEEMSDLFSA